VLTMSIKLILTFQQSLQSLLAINIRNQDSNSFHHMIPQGSVIFIRDPYKTVVQRSDVGFSDRADQSPSGSFFFTSRWMDIHLPSPFQLSLSSILSLVLNALIMSSQYSIRIILFGSFLPFSRIEWRISFEMTL
jgi:hypothetical protein